MNSDIRSEPLICVDAVWKRYCRDFKRSLLYGAIDSFNDIIGAARENDYDKKEVSLRRSEFWANRNISISVNRGECLGLIGCNGSGKTTLLKIISGLLRADSGRATLQGRIGSLIALGAGFSPILTGRENIYVNGAVLGLSRCEIAKEFDNIVAFSEIGDAVDAPVQTYSSGMRVRLGFAIASSLDPDILLVDEVLAVGDVAFRVKCHNRIRKLLENAAVILVSHNMHDISRVCDRVAVLQEGRLIFCGPVHEGISCYYDLNHVRGVSGASELVVTEDDVICGTEVLEFSWKTVGISSTLKLSFRLESIADFEDTHVRVVFSDENGVAVAEWSSFLHSVKFELRRGLNTFDFEIENIRLRSGFYKVEVVLVDLNKKGYLFKISEGLNMVLKSDVDSGPPYRI